MAPVGRVDDARSPGEPRPFTPPRGIGRVLSVVRLIASREQPVSFVELAEAGDVPRTSLFAILKGLAQDGYLVFENDRYSLGPESLKLGQLIASRVSFPEAAMLVLKGLSSEINETVILSELTDDRVHGEYRMVVENDTALRFVVKVGTTRPLNSSAGGNAILAFLPAEERERYLASGRFERFTATTIVDSDELRAAVDVVRENGFSVSVDGSVMGAMAIAAPWFAATGDVAGAVIVGAPTARFSNHHLFVAPALLAAAESISRLAGFTGHYPPR